jgi:hypothetical protein
MPFSPAEVSNPIHNSQSGAVVIPFSVETDLPLPIDDNFWTPRNADGYSVLQSEPTERSYSLEAFNLYADFSQVYERITKHEASFGQVIKFVLSYFLAHRL